MQVTAPRQQLCGTGLDERVCFLRVVSARQHLQGETRSAPGRQAGLGVRSTATVSRRRTGCPRGDGRKYLLVSGKGVSGHVYAVVLQEESCRDHRCRERADAYRAYSQQRDSGVTLRFGVITARSRLQAGSCDGACAVGRVGSGPRHAPYVAARMRFSLDGGTRQREGARDGADRSLVQPAKYLRAVPFRDGYRESGARSWGAHPG